MAEDPPRQEVVLFGGTDRIEALDETWTWDGSTWTLESPPTSPPPRVHAPMAFDASDGEVVLFGGNNMTGEEFGDTWTWDGSTWTEHSCQ